MRNHRFTIAAVAASLSLAASSFAETPPAAEPGFGFELEVQAQAARQPLPYYQQELKERGVEGRVVIKGHVDGDGRLSGIEAVSGHPLLARAAATAMAKWQLEPAHVAGRDVTIAYRFVSRPGARRDTSRMAADGRGAAVQLASLSLVDLP